MLDKFCKHFLQTGQTVGMSIQYMFIPLQCWKQIIPESLFIISRLILKPVKAKLVLKVKTW